MTVKELKGKTHQLIGQAKTEKAIDNIIKWAQENNQEELKNEVALLNGSLTSLNREMNLGLLSNSEITIRQNKINYGVLGLLNNLNEVLTILELEPPPPSGKIKILMLTANPANTTKLNLDREYAAISQKLQQRQEHYNIILKKAVSGSEFQEFTQQEQPAILHFAGHGKGGRYAGIVVQNEDKNEEELISIKGLESLFKLFKKRFKIRVVFLNACHTQEQAAVISKHVDYVIGTNVAIGDTAASAFSSGFYFQLAEDNQMNIEDAFESGRTGAVVKGANEENFVIYKHGKLIEVE